MTVVVGGAFTISAAICHYSEGEESCYVKKCYRNLAGTPLKTGKTTICIIIIATEYG